MGRTILTLILLSSLAWLDPVFAQDLDLSGSWKGILTQRPEGVAAEYDFELYLIQEGNSIRGRSYVTYDTYEATLKIEGQLIREQALVFHETEFVHASELDETLTWCIKSGQLLIKEEEGRIILEGVWQGKTDDGPCVPGKIRLERVIPQA